VKTFSKVEVIGRNTVVPVNCFIFGRTASDTSGAGGMRSTALTGTVGGHAGRGSQLTGPQANLALIQTP
jgi:hypothetical protein